MKKLLSAAALLCIAGTASANLIVNGSFENPNVTAGQGWGLFPSITGWTATGASPIEIGAGGLYGVTGYDGLQVMEMDSTGNAMVQQVVGASGALNLSFLYAQRAGVSTSSGSFEVFWNTVLVASFAPTSTAMTLYSTTVFGNGGNNALAFVGTGAPDSLGAILDNVKLQVPDGGLTAMLLGMGVLGLGWVRRIVK